MTSISLDIGSLSLRPFGASQAGSGGAGAFAAFAGGAGVALKKTQEASSAAATSGEKKGARSQASNAERANRDEIKKYTSEFLMKFAERYNRLPTELQFTSGNLEIIIDEKDENQRDAQRKLLQKVAGIDGDNWAHHKDEKKGGGKGKGAGKRGDSSGNKGDDKDSAHKIQRASDLGRTAWAAGAEEGSKQQGLRKMKGILNKLTPEKFERLLGQLIPLITSHEVLEGTITMVFENAVVQPTFVAMYANLCAELDSILPEFAGKDGKPESFRKMLANTCQEEYESTEFEMKNAERASGAVENKEVQARAKNRLIGNVRLIAELFKKALVNDRIMLLILSDLLGPAENNPAEDWLEAACELVAIAGEKLEASPRSKARLDAIFEHFKRLTNTSSYAPRIRFVVKDVVDLRSQNWVARRETYTAKKLDEIRTEAQAELGIVDVEIPGLTPLGMGGSSGGVGGAGGVGKKTEDVELFPKFKGNLKAASAEDAASEKFTSLLGQFVPISETTEADRATSNVRTDLSDDDRASYSQSVFTDFLSSDSVSDAVSAARELVIPGFGPVLVEIGINRAYDTPQAAEQAKICSLIVELVANKVVTVDDVLSTTETQAKSLDDTMLDVPAAPKILGDIIGGALAKGLLQAAVLGALASPDAIEGAEARRGLLAAALNQVKAAHGEQAMVEAVAGLDIAALMAKDEEFEGHLESTEDFLSGSGLASLIM